MSCANHSCSTDVAVSGEYHTCSLCRSPAYCSEQCRVVDWALHCRECAGVVDVDSVKGLNVATRYYYEDLLTADEVAALPVDDPVHRRYLARHAADRTAYERVSGNALSVNHGGVVPRGAAPPASYKGVSYAIRVAHRNAGEGMGYLHAKDIAGTMTGDMIWKGNAENKLGDATVKRGLGKSASHYIFWPKHSAMRQLEDMTTDVDLEVTLMLGPTRRHVATVAAGVHVEPVRGRQTLAGALRRELMTQLRQKFQREPQLSVDDMVVHRYADGQGNGVVLTFHVVPNSHTMHLVDVEFLLPVQSLERGAGMQSEMTIAEAIVKTPIVCDPASHSHMVALAMAIETAVGEAEDTERTRKLAALGAVIAAHCSNCDDAAAVPPEVSAAVAAAMNLLLVGESERYWKDKASKDFSIASAAVAGLVGKMRDARAKSADLDAKLQAAKGPKKVALKAQRAVVSATKNRINKDAVLFQAALSTRAIQLERDFGPADPNVAKWRALVSALEAARAGSV
jgi:hypothetical protein